MDYLGGAQRLSMRKGTIKMNVKKLVGATAIAGALGMPAFVVGPGTANAVTAAPTDRVNVAQTWQVDWHGDWDGGWHHGGWSWGWGWRR
jgi:hypothetical protein